MGAKRSRAECWVQAGLAVGLAAVLTLAWLLPSDERGYGTHQRLGLPPCSFETMFDVPCASCGFTTSFSHQAKGRIVEGIRVQPAGSLLFWISVALLVLVLWALVRRRSIIPHLDRFRWNRLIPLLAALWAVSWLYKIVTWTG